MKICNRLMLPNEKSYKSELLQNEISKLSTLAGHKRTRMNGYLQYKQWPSVWRRVTSSLSNVKNATSLPGFLALSQEFCDVTLLCTVTFPEEK